MKKNVMIRIDEEVVEKAKDLGLNISKISENALKEYISRLEAPNPQNNTKGFSINFQSKRIEWAEEDLNPRASPRQGDVLTS